MWILKYTTARRPGTCPHLFKFTPEHGHWKTLLLGEILDQDHTHISSNFRHNMTTVHTVLLSEILDQSHAHISPNTCHYMYTVHTGLFSDNVLHIFWSSFGLVHVKASPKHRYNFHCCCHFSHQGWHWTHWQGGLPSLLFHHQ